jgi:hypothetical protein
MKKIINKILNIYDIVLLTALVIMGFKNVKTPIDIILPFLLLPIFFYLTGGLIKRLKKTNWIFWIYSFLFSIIILIADLLNIKRTSDLILIGIVLPLPIYLVIDSVEKIKLSSKNKRKSEDVLLTNEDIKKEEKMDVDETKRKFLKLLAGTGLTTVLMYVFGAKKAQAAFFGNGAGPSTMYLKDSKGNKIDPATNSPAESYGICNIAKGISITTNNYYGYVDKDGNWYILQEDTTGNAFQYASAINNNGKNDYSTAWDGRESLTYGNFSNAF